MNFDLLKQDMIKGWNTWNTTSVLSHVLLPCGFCINVGIKDYATGKVISKSLIGRFEDGVEKIHPGIRSYDGSYTELTVTLGDIKFFVQSAVENEEQYILITPLEIGIKAPTIFAETAFLWNKPGYTYLNNDRLVGVSDEKTIEVFITGNPTTEYHTYSSNPYISVSLDDKVVISSGSRCNVKKAERLMEDAKKRLTSSTQKYGELAETYEAMRSCLAWDTIYEPENNQICSPVSRLWNIHWGGYVLFCWDTFFAAAMIAVENKELAYSNVFAILNEITENGFVPNFGSSNDDKSRDRSQPPVGSMVIWEIYERYGERWFLEECFERLSVWNEWFYNNRRHTDGTFCWGSNKFEPRCGRSWETEGVHDRFGAALESGLDNSPMYDDMPFDKNSNLMMLSDVGLTGLFINDCEYMIKIAKELRLDSSVFEDRAKATKTALQTLWSEQDGFFLNKRTDSGEFSKRISPTNFYALFADNITKEQAERCVKEHFYNRDEFWGDYIIPTIARNDPAYPDQRYWRGRIWAPTNYLAYMALKKAGQDEAVKDLAEKSNELLLKEWRTHGHVHENYCGDTGMGCGVHDSDKFYHWGGLLGFIAIIEKGYGKK